MPAMETFYRPDNYPNWVPWATFSEQRLQLIGTPQELDGGGVPMAEPGFAPRVSFGKPANRTDPTTGRNLRRGYEFQIKLSGTGHMVLSRFRLHAQRLVEKSRATP